MLSSFPELLKHTSVVLAFWRPEKTLLTISHTVPCWNPSSSCYSACCDSSASPFHLSLSYPAFTPHLLWRVCLTSVLFIHSRLPHHFPHPCSVPRSCSSSRQFPATFTYSLANQPPESTPSACWILCSCFERPGHTSQIRWYPGTAPLTLPTWKERSLDFFISQMKKPDFLESRERKWPSL